MSRLGRVLDPTRPDSPGELVAEVPQEELDPGIAGDREVVSRVRLGRVGPSELGPSEVPVELELILVLGGALVGQVDGLGPWSGPEERESGWVERDSEGEAIGGMDSEGVRMGSLGPCECEVNR